MCHHQKGLESEWNFLPSGLRISLEKSSENLFGHDNLISLLLPSREIEKCVEENKDSLPFIGPHLIYKL